jgi:peroxin-5
MSSARLHRRPRRQTTPSLALPSQAFFTAAASRSGLPAQLAPLPPGALSVPEQVRIRDRATILARQVYADQGQGFADGRVAELLGAMGVDVARLPAGLPHVHDESWHALWATQQQAGPREPMAAADLAANMEAAWREQQQQRARPWWVWAQPVGLRFVSSSPAGALAWGPLAVPEPLLRTLPPNKTPCPHRQLPHAPSTGWADEFATQQQQQPPSWAEAFANEQQQQPPSWAEEFTHGEGEKWAGEFDAAAAAATSASDARAADPAEAVAASRRMVEVLSADADPKMRNSQFLQFLSKMSRGELLLDEGGLREADPAAAAAARQWADEFEATRAAGGGSAAAWADDFARQQQQQAGPVPQRQRDWADEFAAGVADFQISAPEDAATAEQLDAAWAEVGAGAVPLAGAADWVREFGGGEGAAGPAEWDELFERAQAEAAAGLGAPLQAGGRREYVFTDPNPFLGDAAALAKGKEL